MMNILSIGLSGLNAASLRASTAASNIANLSTTGALSSENGPAPYQTRITTQQSAEGGGVNAQQQLNNPGFIPVFDSGSPFANADGVVGAPNTNLAEEIVNLKLAEISYKANIKTIEAVRNLTDDLLNIFDEEA